MDAAQLLQSIRTKEEKDTILSQIDLLISSLYTPSVSILKLLEKSVPLKTKQILTLYFSYKKIDLANTSQLKNILEELKGIIQNLKPITLTLAIHPSEQMLTQIHAFANQNFEKNTILDIQYDSKILGGAVITFNGMYKDYSLKKTLNAYFEKKKTEAMKTIV